MLHPSENDRAMLDSSPIFLSQPEGWSMDDRAWFKQKVQVQQSGCWLWMGGSNVDGYGQVWWKGRNEGAHRLAYRLFIGEIPSGLVVRHRCDVRRCVNPDHLTVGTLLDNARDMIERGRRRTGVRVRFGKWFDQPNACDLFLLSVDKAPNGCWLWMKGRNVTGYGIIGFRGKSTTAHRVSYALFKGEIPEGTNILHSCDNPPCVNPDHLRVGSHADNVRDAVERERHQRGDNHWMRRTPERRARGQRLAEAITATRPRGDDHWSRRMPERINLGPMKANPARGAANSQSKLTAQDIPVIREAVRTGTPLRQLARAYHVTTSVIRGAAFGPTWLHIPGALDRATTPKATVPRGAAHYHSKLTDEIVLAMRRRARDGERIKEVAASYGIGKTPARLAIRGVSWKHLPGAVVLHGADT